MIRRLVFWFILLGLLAGLVAAIWGMYDYTQSQNKASAATASAKPAPQVEAGTTATTSIATTGTANNAASSVAVVPAANHANTSAAAATSSSSAAHTPASAATSSSSAAHTPAPATTAPAAATHSAPAPAAVTPVAGATPAKAALTVSLVSPNRQAAAETLAADGNVSAWQEASVGSQVNGLRIEQVLVNIGDQVKRGQVLAKFSDDSVMADILQAKAAMLQAQANYENAKADAARARSIQDTGALSKSQIAGYFTQEKVAAAQVEAAKASFNAQQIRLTYTQIKSPDNGIISARNASVGTVTNAGQELFKLIRQGRLEWRAELNADQLSKVRIGTPVSLVLPSGKPLPARVRAIAPNADTQTRKVIAYVDLPPNAELKSGLYVKGNFSFGLSEALLVPQQAVILRDGHEYVFVIDGANRVSQREVQTGRRLDGKVELMGGITESEQVVAQGAGFLNDGDTVKVVVQ